MRAHRENAGLGPLALTVPRRTLTERTLYPPPPPPSLSVSVVRALGKTWVIFLAKQVTLPWISACAMSEVKLPVMGPRVPNLRQTKQNKIFVSPRIFALLEFIIVCS